MGELSDGPEHAASSGSNALVLWEPPQAYAEAAAEPAPRRAFARAGLQRAGRAAKLALMIWGGVSLTAAGAYAVGHVLSAPVQLRAEATAEPPQSAAVRGNAGGNAAAAAAPAARAQAKPRVVAIGEPEAAPAKPSAKPTPNTIAARPAGPAAESPARRLQPLTNADDVGEAGSGFTRKPEVRVRGEVAQRRVSPEDFAPEDFAPEEFGPGADEPVVAARVPRPRPDDFVVRPRREPTITGSIEERWEEIRRPRRWDRRVTTWRDGEGRRFQRLPRYFIVR
jgi:hypothetical protein